MGQNVASEAVRSGSLGEVCYPLPVLPVPAGAQMLVFFCSSRGVAGRCGLAAFSAWSACSLVAASFCCCLRWCQHGAVGC